MGGRRNPFSNLLRRYIFMRHTTPFLGKGPVATVQSECRESGTPLHGTLPACSSELFKTIIVFWIIILRILSSCRTRLAAPVWVVLRESQQKPSSSEKLC